MPDNKLVVIGGDAAGMSAAAKVLVTALHAGLTAEQAVYLELSYAPPYSPAWDPVQTAARQLLNEL